MISPLKPPINPLAGHALLPETADPSWTAWLVTLAGHALFVATVYSVLYATGLLQNAPNPDNIIGWDAGWFNSVRTGGYVGSSGQTNIPFFPLFPYLWRLLGVGGLGISAVNAGLLLLGAAWLGRTFGLRRHQVLLLLSVPPVFFCFVPYAEALFFLFGAVLLRGLHRQHLGLTVLGLLGCCLTRSAATLFVPALVLAEVLACTARPQLPRLVARLGAGLLAVAGALGTVFYLHYRATGNLWALFVAYEHWGHAPSWPQLHQLHSSAGITVLWFDALALLVGLMAGVACLGLGVRWLAGWFRPGPAPVAPSRAVVFALGYCAAAVGFILVYQQASDITGASRYVLATPFFGLLLAQLARWRQLGPAGRWAGAGLLAAGVVGVAVWLGWPARFPGFYPAETQWFFALWVVYLGLYGLAAPRAGRYRREVRAGLYVANVVYQAFLLNLFLGATWLG